MSLRGAQSILYISLAVRLLSITALVVCAYLQQAFDTSHVLLSYTLDPNNHHGLLGVWKPLLAFVRWDTIYFVSLASPEVTEQHIGGYHMEQSLAFQPGIVYLLRWTGYVTPSLDGTWSPTSAILLTTFLANVATLISPVLLFKLSRRLNFRNDVAYTAALLSIFAPTAGTTLSSPTPEAFYSFATLCGLLSLESGTSLASLTIAAAWFGVATLFRTNGILLSGFLAWKLLFAPSLLAMHKHVLTAALLVVPLVLISIGPFVLFQVWASSRLCQAFQEPFPSWCSATFPNAYSHVQSTYWNVGPFRYWTLDQLPNFALASPVLLMLGHGVYTYFSGSTAKQIARSMRPFQDTSATSATAQSSAMTLQSGTALVPYAVYSAIVGLVLLTASHVQISLRFASPGGLPLVWWSAATLALKSPKVRRTVITYLCLQYAVAIVLYAGFYPPA